MKSAIKKLIIWIVVLAAVGGAGYALYATGVVNQILGTEYDITFVVEGKEYTQKVRHGKMPEFEGTPQKEGDDHTEYVFDGWEPELKKATKNAKYTAKFVAKERLFEINLQPTYDGAAQFVGGGKVYKYGDNATLEIASINAGYIFDGWYVNGDLKTTDMQFTINNITKDLTVVPKFTIITKTISYENLNSATNANQATYDIRDGNIVLTNLQRNGYDFLGWFLQEMGGEPITQIDASALQDYTLYARWQIKVYQITYSLNGGNVDGENPEEYTIESEPIVLINPTKDGATFLGWNSENLDAIAIEVTIPTGTYGDLQFVAIWDDLKYAITFVVDGEECFDKQYVYFGANTLDPTFDPADAGMGGYVLDGWYVDSLCTQKFVFGETLYEDITLFGKWGDYFIETSFCSYYSKFKTANATTPIHISSDEELVAWIDYIKFFNITERLLISFGDLSDQNLLDKFSVIARAIADETDIVKFPLTGYLSFNVSGSAGSISIGSSTVATDATQRTTDIVGFGGLCEQQDYAYAMTCEEVKSSFNIDQLSGKNVYGIETTNQLYYVLERGYRPICEEGSIAEATYERAKEILSTITTNSMTDIQKLKAIYEWLILNVQYDNFAVSDASVSENWEQYRSWYAEGAILDGVAVCDGFAKAFVIFAEIENIPCVRVTGKMYDEDSGKYIGHAWNKVYIDGKWFGIDATHGNCMINGQEVLLYTNFMFTDTYKEHCGCVATNYLDFESNTEFNVYNYLEYSNGVDTFGLYINSTAELRLVLAYVQYYEKSEDATYFTVDLAFADGVACIPSTIGLAIEVVNCFELDPDTNGHTVYVLYLRQKAH